MCDSPRDDRVLFCCMPTRGSERRISLSRVLIFRTLGHAGSIDLAPAVSAWCVARDVHGDAVELLRARSEELQRSRTVASNHSHGVAGQRFRSRFCLVELDILLFAIEVCEDNGQRRLAINPDRTSKYYRIAKRTRGFFLAGSSEEASR